MHKSRQRIRPQASDLEPERLSTAVNCFYFFNLQQASISVLRACAYSPVLVTCLIHQHGWIFIHGESPFTETLGLG